MLHRESPGALTGGRVSEGRRETDRGKEKEGGREGEGEREKKNSGRAAVE